MRQASTWLAVLAGASVALIGGCEKKKEPPPPVVAAPAEPPRPQVSLQDITMDPRVQFPDERTPSSQELAEAIAALASAIAKGDAAAMSELLDDADRAVLDDMQASGDFKRGTSGIEAVRVNVLRESDDKQSAEVGLGVQDKQGAYLLGWKGTLTGGNWVFRAMAIDQITAARVSQLDDKDMREVVSAAAPAAAPEPAPTPEGGTPPPS